MPIKFLSCGFSHVSHQFRIILYFLRRAFLLIILSLVTISTAYELRRKNVNDKGTCSHEIKFLPNEIMMRLTFKKNDGTENIFIRMCFFNFSGAEFRTKLLKIFESFSLVRNIKQLTNFSPNSDYGLVHATKFLLLLVIIYGHRRVYSLGYPNFNPERSEIVSHLFNEDKTKLDIFV